MLLAVIIQYNEIINEELPHNFFLVNVINFTFDLTLSFCLACIIKDFL